MHQQTLRATLLQHWISLPVDESLQGHRICQPCFGAINRNKNLDTKSFVSDFSNTTMFSQI